MKTARWGVLALYCAAALASAPAALGRSGADQPAPAAAAPRVEVEKETLDFGDVVRGGKVEATFVLKNTGNDTLKILSAKPG